ncbi:MAG: PDZ domain-containing protein, partial [Oscillochloris sp.]|nr:PDZ domain-containing protein [Oscillochloris sp.]
MPTAVSVPSTTLVPVLPSLTALLEPTTDHASTARPTRPPTPTSTIIPLSPIPTLAALDAGVRERIFQQVWETVRDHYLYEDYRGTDWQVVREEFMPRVASVSSTEEFYGLMRQMIDRLGDDHSRFESPQEVAEQEAEFTGTLRYGGIGAEIRDVDEGGLVSTVVPDGPAARAGIQPRDIITAVDGISFFDSEAFGPDGPIGRVRGEPGTSVRLSVFSPGQDVREVLVTRQVID